MSESPHPDPKSQDSSELAGAASGGDQVENLLSEVDALADEILAESTAANEGGTPGTAPAAPLKDPAREVAADDVGLAAESPLIQDGERVAAEEVVADIDRELDHMETLIASLGAVGSGAEPEARAVIPDIPQTPAEIPTVSTSEEADAAAALLMPGEDPPEASGPHRPPAQDEASSSAGASDTENVRAEQAGTAPPRGAAAEDSPAERAEPPTAPAVDHAPDSESVVEQELDHDLDALLSGGMAGDEGSDGLSTELPPDDLITVAAGDVARPAAVTADEALADISLWKLLRARLRVRTRRHVQRWLDALTDALVWVMDQFDQRLGGRLSSQTKELVGYCALGTLAMALVALLIALF